MKAIDMTKTTTVAAYTAGTITTYLGLTSEEWGVVAMITGIFISAATAAINAWFQWDKRKRDIQNGIKTSNKG